ncbi:MAG: magnesium transporter CorA family protein [Actinomycetota bacterium]
MCRSKDGWERVEDLESLSELRTQEGTLLWAESDVANLTDQDIATIAEEFDLDALAVEDATAARQRPKLEKYSNHLFMTLHQLDEEEGQLEPAQLAFFIGPRYVLTIHHGASRVIEAAKDRWRDHADEQQGPAHLLHTILDVVVDEYQIYADAAEEEIEDLEDLALTVHQTRVQRTVQRKLYSVKQRISRLRRYALPAERVVDGLLDTEEMFGDLQDETKNLFRDVKDHVKRMEAQLRSVDELTQGVLDLVRGEQAEALAVQGRKLSAWAAIFAVATLIAGIYGMNFALVPEEGSLSGFWFAVSLMVGICIALYVWFKRRRWL